MGKRFFGTDGIRGVAIKPPLDPETLVRIGQAIAKILTNDDRRHQILIGKDTRLSGYMIESSLAAGITSMGVNVLLVGPLPTPGVAYLTKSMRVDAGIMISASHNPYEDNGIKIFGPDGLKLADEKELLLEALLEPGALDGATVGSSAIGKARRIDDAVGRYTVYLKSCFPRECTLDGVRIGLDCAHGAAYVVAPQTFEELGAEVMLRGASPNGRNINAGFGSLYPEISQKLVKENNLDLGISLDGDADRAIFVDERGTILDGDVILAIIAIEMKARNELRVPKIVSTVMSNLGLDHLLKSKGISLERTQVGDRYVLEKMLELGCQLGGEQSGHIINGDLATTGDGVLTALMLLSVMSRTGKSLSELAADFVRFPQILINIDVSKKPELSEVASISEAISKTEAELGDTGRVLVRYSGTENKARVMVECEDQTKCQRYAQRIAEAIEREIGC